MNATETRTFCKADTREIVHQINPMTLLAISGGRVVHRDTGITLPVGSGYSVTIDLDASDTYVVRRVFKRGAKTWIKGERDYVYCDEVSEAAYYASCFVSYDAEEWVAKF